ncbi:MAG: hypothetical protein ACLUL2_12295 [Blautia sp.]
MYKRQSGEDCQPPVFGIQVVGKEARIWWKKKPPRLQSGNSIGRVDGGEVGGREVEVEEHEEDVEGEHLEEETGFGVGFKVFYKSCKGFH